MPRLPGSLKDLGTSRPKTKIDYSDFGKIGKKSKKKKGNIASLPGSPISTKTAKRVPGMSRNVAVPKGRRRI